MCERQNFAQCIKMTYTKVIKNFAILLFTLCWGVSSREIPSYVHLCKRNDPKAGECFANTFYELLPHLLKGIPEMDIPSIDPLEFHQIKVNTGNTGSVSMNIELLNGTISGLKNLRIENHKMDFDNMKFTATLVIPQVRIEGTYKISGKILLFELNGQGHCSFNASDVHTNSKWLGSTYTKKNKIHMGIDDIFFNDVQLKNIQVKLDNLFNDDALTETVNSAINSSIDTLQEELEPIIKETLKEMIRDYFNRVYRTFPLDQLYPKE